MAINKFQNLDSIKLVEDELRSKLAEADRKLTEAQNRENQLEREKVELREKHEQTLEQMQKLKDDLDDGRQETENVNISFFRFFFFSLLNLTSK